MSTRIDDAITIRTGAIRLGRRLRAERPQGSLSGTAVSVLSHLHREGPSTPSAIAQAEHQRPQSLTRTFRELEGAGLIRRTVDPSDRRGAVLTLTGDGRSALARDMASRDAWLVGAL